jgi:hypothetical protein
MKKFVFALAVLLLASQAWALDISCTVDGCDVTVSYTGADGPPRVRAMALDITVSDGNIGDVQCLSAAYGYQIYPGSISIDGSGNVSDWGSCKCDGSYPGTLDADDAMTIEMGSLYEAGVDDDPCAAGDLVSFRVTGNATDSDVTIVVNDIRGGCVDEDAAVVTPGITGCQVPAEAPDTCLNSAATEYAEWQSWGSPDCWCYQRQCRGDIDGQRILMKWVQGADLTIFRSAFLLSDLDLAAVTDGICADLDHKRILMKRVQGADLTILRTYFLESDANVPVCDQAPVITGPYNFWTN